jgi:hypothetical protein
LGGCRKTRRRKRNGGRAYWEQISFFDALQGLEVARKYIQQLNVGDDILVHAVSSKTSSIHWSIKKNVNKWQYGTS